MSAIFGYIYYMVLTIPPNLSLSSFIRYMFNNINAAMKKAVVPRYIPYNPCERVVLPKLKKYKATVCDQKTIHQLLDAVKGTDMYLPILLLVTVGLRRGELLALRWEDIDFTNKILKVRKNMVKGEKGHIIKASKSEAGIRDIHLGDDIVEELKIARKQYLMDSITYGQGFQNLGFVVRQEDSSPCKPDSIAQKWGRLLEQKSLPKIRLYDLRHSNATALIQAGVNPRVVQ